MSTQRHTDQVKLAAKNRRNCVVLSVLRGSLAIMLAVAGIGAAFGARGMLTWAFRHQSLVNGHFGDWMMGLQIGIFLALFAGLSGFISYTLVKTQVKTVCVPPVYEHFVSRPAEGILVRPSVEPAATPDDR